MEKKNYKQPLAEIIPVKANCMLGNESGIGEGASLHADFEEEGKSNE